jgi:nucleotide-binding universal stress UspA family protein
LQEILVAVDGSKYSRKVVELSCELAKQLSDKILLIYVSKSPDVVEDYIEFGGEIPTPRSERVAALADAITSKLGEYIRAQNIPFEILLESGNPAQKILQTASERKSSMIVVGLKGLHGVARIRSLGSVSRRVIENSNCPVIVVTEEI